MPHLCPRRCMSGSAQLRERRLSEFTQQCPRIIKIRAVEPLGEPTVGGSKQLVCCSVFAQFVPKLGEARGGTQLKRPRSHIRRYTERLLKTNDGFIELTLSY